MTERGRTTRRRVLEIGRTLAFTLSLVVLLVSVVGPVFGPGQAAVTPRYTYSPPTTCTASPHPPTAGTTQTAVTATLAQNETNPELLELHYNASGTPDVLVRFDSAVRIVASEGFDRSDTDENDVVLGSRGPRWNASADDHWIRYRTGPQYPHGDGWQLTPTPRHAGAAVALQTAGDGYVGPHVTYLGSHETRTVTSGCQTITAIVPDRTAPFLSTDARLADLQYAAGALEGGHAREQVRVFVSPTPIGTPGETGRDRYGYTLGETGTVVVGDSNAILGSWNAVAWLHEYVHTRQPVATMPEPWTIEGSATYLSRRLALERGRLSPRTYDMFLARDASGQPRPLAAQGIQSPVAYRRGSVVLSRVEQASWRANRTTVDALLFHRAPQRPRTVVDALRRAGVLESHRTSIDQLITTAESVQPAYVLGPVWLPRPVRIVLGFLGLPTVRRGATLVLGVWVVTTLYERSGYELRVGDRIRTWLGRP